MSNRSLSFVALGAVVAFSLAACDSGSVVKAATTFDSGTSHLAFEWRDDVSQSDRTVDMYCADNGDRIYIAYRGLTTAAIAVVPNGCTHG